MAKNTTRLMTLDEIIANRLAKIEKDEAKKGIVQHNDMTAAFARALETVKG